MEMLRDFLHKPSLSVVHETVNRFDVEIIDGIDILRFEVISPDSFMWRLQIDDNIYYLYAEDYVPGLGYISSVFSRYIENNEWSFVKPRKAIDFEDATPVLSARVYEKSDDSDDMMQYTVDSGYDFVFLAKSGEDADRALFSKSAPRGFE